MKKIFKISAFLIVILMVLSFSTDSKTWVLYKEINGVKIFCKLTDCDFQGKNYTYYAFKYENSTNESKTLNYKLNIWLGEKCRSCNLPSPNEYELSIKLNSKQIIEGECSNKDDKRFMLLKSVNDNKTRDLTKFELDNIQVQ